MGTLISQRIKDPKNLDDQALSIAHAVEHVMDECPKTFTKDQAIEIVRIAVESQKVWQECDRQNAFDEQMGGFGMLFRTFIQSYMTHTKDEENSIPRDLAGDPEPMPMSFT